jgi:hypothetical protein
MTRDHAAFLEAMRGRSRRCRRAPSIDRMFADQIRAGDHAPSINAELVNRPPSKTVSVESND